jgi:abhydrolase domain-containing protein 17
LNDLEPIWLFVTKVMNFQPKDILVMGRSIGSGPACHFATMFECGALALISPFTSIKAVAEHNFGSIAARLLSQRFDNLSKIDKIRCPCLFIHGKEDTLIPYQHSKELYSSRSSPAKCSQPAEVLIFSGMTHQYFDLTECVSMPTVKFLEKVQPDWIRQQVSISIPKFIFAIPDTNRTTSHLSTLSKKYCDWKDCEMSPESTDA